jgi:hypothetical protein
MFRQGIISSVSSPSPFYIKNVLEPDMINVGWQLVSSNITANVGNTSNMWLWDVLWSSNASNEIGKDWFIAIGWDNMTNSNIVCTVVEQWNGVGQSVNTSVGANTCMGYPPSFPVSGSAPVTNNWCNVNQTTLPFTPGTNAGCLCTTTVNALSPVSFTYSHSVSIDAVITMSSNTASVNAGHAYYLGTYDSFLNPVSDPYPIVGINLGLTVTNITSPAGPGTTPNPTTTWGFQSREPCQNAAPVLNFNWSAFICGPLNTITTSETTVTTAGNGIDFYANKFIYSRPVIAGRNGIGMKGLLKNIYLVNMLTTRGDTTQITVNGQTYTAIFISGAYVIQQTNWYAAGACFLEI